MASSRVPPSENRGGAGTRRCKAHARFRALSFPGRSGHPDLDPTSAEEAEHPRNVPVMRARCRWGTAGRLAKSPPECEAALNERGVSRRAVTIRIGWFLLWLALVLVQCASSEGQTPHSNEPKAPNAPIRQARTLQVTSTRVLTVPAFGFWGLPLCDDAGDLYFQPSGKADSAIFKLSQPDESNSRMFQIPSEGSESDSLIDYTVTPSGALYVLAQDVKQKFHVYSFEPDGGVKHNVKLETPDYALLVDFAVFDNDTILGTGYYQRDAPGTLHGKSYAVLFDQSGQLLKDMTSRFSLDATSSDQTGPLNHISIRPGKDGNLYLLGSSAVLVISPSGEIIRRIKFVKPDPATAAVASRGCRRPGFD